MTRFNVFFTVYCVGSTEWFWTVTGSEETFGPFEGEALATIDATYNARNEVSGS